MRNSLVLLFSSFSLSFSASVFILILLALIAVGYAIYVYRHTIPEVSRAKRIQLITLRSLALALLLFLIFEPILNLEKTETTSPRIALLLDDSKSMTIQDAAGMRGEEMRKLIASPVMDALRRTGDVTPIVFGKDIHELKSLTPDSLRFGAGETDITNAMGSAHSSLKEKNVQAFVLISDGSYTTGTNPVHLAERLGIPMYTVGIGDSTEKKDIIVKHIIANEIAYVESKIPIEVALQSAGFTNESIDVTLREGSTMLERKSLTLRPGVNEYSHSFLFEPKTDGVKRLTISAQEMPGELTQKNNGKSVFIKVLKSKMKIVVFAGAPSADVSRVQQVLKKDKNIEAKFYIQKVGNTWYDSSPDQRAIMEADCIFFVGFPIRQTDPSTLLLVKNALEKLNKPLFLLFSRAIDLAKLRASLDAYLPFDLIQAREDEVQVFFELTPAGMQHPVTSTGVSKELWQKLPPLYKTESSTKARLGAEQLAVMKINNISFNEPILLARKLNRNKIVSLSAYGLWQWELARDEHTPDIVQTFLGNIIRWLTTREDDKFVRIKPVKEFFDNGEMVEFTGQVYNESYEPLDEAVVVATVKSSKVEQQLTLTSIGAGRYQGALEALPEGDYQYSATASKGSVAIGSDRGRFSVGDMNFEYIDTKMNNTLLRQIAYRSGGKFYLPSTVSTLPQDIARQKTFASKESIIRNDIQLWNFIWLLALVIVLLAIEWYLRKQAGMI